MKRTILLAGATGLVGSKLFHSLKDDFDFFLLGRNIASMKEKLSGAKKYIDWSNETEIANAIRSCFGVINLSGAGIADKRWTPSYKKIILESRTESTRQLVSAIKNSEVKPSVYIAASGIGIYGDRENQTLTESSSFGNDFLAMVCDLWESESKSLAQIGVRRVVLRIGVALSNEGGALMKMITPFKFFIGGKLGSGRQFLSWIHIDDLISIFRKSLEEEKYSGVINAASPNPVTMHEFSKTLGRILKRPSIFPVPEFVLKLILGESAIMVIGGQNVAPKKLLENDFRFGYAKLDEALRELLNGNKL